MTREFSILFGKPNKNDGIYLYDLVSQCPPLDLNSLYAYHLVARHFYDTSVVVRKSQTRAPAGMVSAYLLPENRETLFIWQVAVSETMRGQGLAVQMLEHLLKRPALRHIKYIETTISPSNLASQKLFHHITRKLSSEITESDFLKEDDFKSLCNVNEASHEEEKLFRIGPVSL